MLPTHSELQPDLLRRWRRSASFTVEQVAVQIGRGYTTVIGYERGVITPPANVLANLAALYGCKIDDFFAAPVGA